MISDNATAPIPVVDRPHYVELIGTLLKSDDVVVLHGDQGCGKTTLLRAFADIHSSSSVALFLRPASRYSYDPYYVTSEICGRLRRVLGDALNVSSEDSSEADLCRLYSRLAKGRPEQPVYFVVDGLDQIPLHDRDILPELLDLMPFGIPRCKFVFTGKQVEEILRCKYGQLSIGQNSIPGFSPPEVEQYFSGVEVREDDILKIRELAGKGNPSKLVAIRRLISSGTPLWITNSWNLIHRTFNNRRLTVATNARSLFITSA